MISFTEETRQKAFSTQRKPETVESQGLPHVRFHVEEAHLIPAGERPKKFLEAFAAILKHTNYRFMLDQYSRVSAKCARCSANCQIYETTHAPEDVPCFRSEMLLSIYRRHFTVGGAVKGRLTGDVGLTEEKIDELADSVYNCTACRRCTLECPMGIDHGLITHLARWILAEIGIAPRALVVSTREQLVGATGNTSAIPLPALQDTIEFLEEEIADYKGVEIKVPMDVEGAEYMFIAPVSDWMMEAETLMGCICALHAGGVSWTVGTQYYDAINYGLFYSDHHLEQVLHKVEAEVKRLGVKKILIGECGHASRSAKFFYNVFAEQLNIPVINILEVTHDLLKQGKLKFDTEIIKEKVTYHDPCNIARPGWVIEQPREIIKAFIKNYEEMTPSGRDNLCCGGGGGTVSIDELRPYRTLITGRRKAEQIEKTGAEIVIAPCANCKKQVRELLEDNEVPVELVGLHDLIYKAIILSDDGIAWHDPMGDDDWTPPDA
ncbi:hypothetical protein GF324_06750 [bacterium]|nr:hypothetical protein [bacterium]